MPRTPRYSLRRYGRRHGNSGVIAYATGRDTIVVQFNSGETYLYTSASVGRAHLAAMQRCAEAGAGLSAYISRHAHDRYACLLKTTGVRVASE